MKSLPDHAVHALIGAQQLAGARIIDSLASAERVTLPIQLAACCTRCEVSRAA